MLNENTARFSSGCTIAQAKKNANRLKKTSKLKLAKALDLIAASVEPGCNSWPAAIEKVTARYTIEAPADLSQWPARGMPQPLSLPGGGIIVLTSGQANTNTLGPAWAMATYLCSVNCNDQRQLYWATNHHSLLNTLAEARTALTGIRLAELPSLTVTPGALVVVDLRLDSNGATEELGHTVRLAAAGAIVIVLANDPADINSVTPEYVLKQMTVKATDGVMTDAGNTDHQNTQEWISSKVQKLRDMASTRVALTDPNAVRFNEVLVSLSEVADKLEVSLSKHLGVPADTEGSAPAGHEQQV